MKKIFVAVLVGTALSVSACGGSGEPTPRETVYVESSPSENNSSQNNSSSVEEEFLYDISLYSTPELRAQPDAELIRLGEIICQAFDEGASLAQIVEAGNANGAGMSEQGIITVAASAVVNFCPEHNNGGGIGA